MKKYIILTSVLALAACGGGGGHHGTGGDRAMLPERAVVSDTARASNGNITTMASEILVPKGAGTVIARPGSVSMDGLSYTSYRLDDVSFRVATGGGNDALLHFNMDPNGRIDSLNVNVGAGKQELFRRDDTSDFRGIVYEYVLLEDNPDAQNYAKEDRDTLVRLVFSAENDPTDFSVLSEAAAGKCPTGSSCRWDRIDQAFRVTSTGSEDAFKYSDFGKLQTANFGKYKDVTAENFEQAKTHTRDGDGVIGDADDWDSIVFDDDEFDVFGGGYKLSVLQHKPTTDMHFTGKAIGSVYATDSAAHPDDNKALKDNAASLDFVDGTETLTMNFNNDESKWYKVVVTRDANGNNIKFSDFNESGNAGTRFKNETGGEVSLDNFTQSSNVAGVKREGLLDMGYYGITGPEEATGVVRYKETTKESNVQYEREFRAGYGMKPVTE
jgi:hypothetical protein